METKKINFDWSIFIAVMTICVVIVCGVVCCCLALPSNDNGIAKAQENIDYLVAPGDSYTSSEKCSSIVQDATLQILRNIIYINFNYQFVEEEFFALFNSTFSEDYTEENGGLNDSYYCYPLITFQVDHGGRYYDRFHVVALGWQSAPEYNGIYIFDDNVGVDDYFVNYIASHTYYEFLSEYRYFIITAFYKFQYLDTELPVYTSIVSRNLMQFDEDFIRIQCHFDSTRITDHYYGIPYEETILPFFDSLFSLNGVFNINPLYVAPNVSGVIGDEDYSFQGYGHFNYNVEKQYLKTIADEFISYIRDGNTYTYNELSGLVYILASFSVSADPYHYYFGIRDDDSLFVIVNEEEGYLAPPYGMYLDTFLPFGNTGDNFYFYEANYGFSYISPFWYSDYCSLDIGMFFSMSDNFLSYADVQVLKQQKAFNEELAQKDEEIARQDGVIDSLQEDLRYYESLELNYRYVPINYLAGIKTYSFTKDGVNYSSNSIERSSNAREIYNFYNNAQLDVPPESMGVCFAIELDKTYNNVKFKFSPIIDCYYQYTICSAPDESGTQQCYQHNGIFNGINVGYVRQNGEIESLGQYSSMPGASDGEFLLNYPTNTLVFYYNGMTQITLPDDFTLGLYMYDPDKIYNDGYQVGFNKGYTEGKNVGYYEGLGADTDISFFALFTSVFDAPITSIVGKWGDSDGDGVYEREGGMLNFYIPGLEINFAPFLLSLFTIAVIVLIIRFILARKS